eukprot:6200414-Pleurochrysis_carterae.AAC.1
MSVESVRLEHSKRAPAACKKARIAATHRVRSSKPSTDVLRPPKLAKTWHLGTVGNVVSSISFVSHQENPFLKQVEEASCVLEIGQCARRGA